MGKPVVIDPSQPFDNPFDSPLNRMSSVIDTLFKTGAPDAEQHAAAMCLQRMSRWLDSDRTTPPPTWIVKPRADVPRQVVNVSRPQHPPLPKTARIPARGISVSVQVADNEPVVVAIDPTSTRFEEVLDDTAALVRNIVMMEYLPDDGSIRQATGFELRRALHRLQSIGAIAAE